MQHADSTLAYVRQILRMPGPPPIYSLLQADLPPLSAPLQLHRFVFDYISARTFDSDRLRTLAVNVEEQQQPAIVLAAAISYPIWTLTVSRGESMVLKDTLCLVLDPMSRMLEVLGISFDLGGDVADPSGATESQKRPDGLLFLRNVLMFKVCKRPPQPLVSMTS